MQNNEHFVSILKDVLVIYSIEYDNKVVLSSTMFSFIDSPNFVSLIKNKTYFKGTGSFIDLILTNRKYSFQNTSSYETGLSDHHHLIYSVMKIIFKYEESKKIIYRNYSNFSQKDFQSELSLNIRDGKNNYLEFQKNFAEMLDKYTSKKTKIFRGNHKPHIEKSYYETFLTEK